jgi:hypothetical protein
MKYAAKPDSDCFIRLLSRANDAEFIDVNIAVNCVFRRLPNGGFKVVDMTFLNPRGGLIQIGPPYPNVVPTQNCTFKELRELILSQFKEE